METVLNRIDREYQALLQEEAKLNVNFPAQANKITVQAQKLKQLNKIIGKYSGDLNASEQMTLIRVKAAAQDQRKKLYGKDTASIIVQRVIDFFAVRSYRKEHEQASRENIEQVLDIVDKTGFGRKKEEILKRMKSGEDSFTIRTSNNISSDTRLDYDLQFVKDENGYRFEQFRLKMSKGAKHELIKEHTFKVQDSLDIDSLRAYNLISGRPIYNMVIVNGNVQGLWAELDFNHKDAQLNFLVKKFYGDQTLNLDKQLEGLGLKGILTLEDYKELLTELKNGNSVHIQHPQIFDCQKIRLCPDPGTGKLLFFDQSNQPIGQRKNEVKTKQAPVVKTTKKVVVRNAFEQSNMQSQHEVNKKQAPEVKPAKKVKVRNSLRTTP